MTSVQNDDNDSIYEAHPFVQSMLRHETTRTKSLTEQGKNQMNYPQSGDGWFTSIFMIQGRALDWMIYPWLFVVGHATLYTVVQELFFDERNRETDTWENFFRCGQNSTSHIISLLVLICYIPQQFFDLFVVQFCIELDTSISSSFSIKPCCESVLDSETVLG
jgi:hypothetical protein